MADNFNLRSFLSENKLTKNAQLLKEQEGFKTFQDSGMEGLYMDTVGGVKIYSATDSSVSDYCAYILEYPDGKIDIVDLDVSGQPISSEELQEYDVLSDKPEIADFISRDIAKELGEGEMDETSHSMKNKMNEEVSLNGKPVDVRSIEIDGIDTSDYPDFVDAYIAYAEFEDGTPLTEEELIKLEEENYGIVGELIFDRQLYTEGTEEAGKEGVEEAVNENTMTNRERRLVEMVQRALGEENVDYTMSNQDDPNQLPNPASQLYIPEGDEMVEEKPLPKYENIEKLMQEIDKSTDEAAHKYKMEEMKRVADGLEKKATALEEGDNAEHIDQKKLKQMKKDIMSLRKGIEKMEKLGEKKFAKKETKETKADLKEGFDLRNFLVENKLTTNSRMLSEEINPDIEDIVGWILEQPVYEDISPEELGALAKDYLEEWKNSKQNFNSLEEYLNTVEENGDFL